MRLLDLFCGAGGAAMGYHRAGFDEIVGVDIVPQPHYPFTFVQADAMTYPLDGFDAIHASPPCQHFTKYRNRVKDITDRYSDFLPQTRERLANSGLPWVMENVVGAPMAAFVLCGSMFQGRGTVDIQRHRLFESSVFILTPGCDHSIWSEIKYTGGRSISRGGALVLCRKTIEIGKWGIPLAVQQEAMGIDWMTLRELSESIPPAYTEFIGEQLIHQIASVATREQENRDER